MSIRRLGKNTFIRLGDRWFGIQHIEWIRFDEKTLFSSKSVTINLREVRSTYDEGSDEYKFFKTHFEKGEIEQKESSKQVVQDVQRTDVHKPNSMPGGMPGGMPTYSSSVKGRH